MSPIPESKLQELYRLKVGKYCDQRTEDVVREIGAFRTKIYCHASLETVDVREKAETSFIASLYWISLGFESLLVACYGDEDILWIDNNYDDKDFELFAKRENLLNWKGFSPLRLAQLFIETKFDFLYSPKVISVVSDIPLPPDERIQRITNSLREDLRGDYFDYIEQQKVRLAVISSQIQPPRFSNQSETMTFLDFSVWTLRSGMVFNLHCKIDSRGAFDYQGAQLENMLGDFVIQR